MSLGGSVEVEGQKTGEDHGIGTFAVQIDRPIWHLAYY